MKAILPRNFTLKGLQVFLVLCFVSVFLIGNIFHSHKEVNLHFHAENLLTQDHTTAVDKDCKVCDLAIVSSSSLLTRKEKIYFNVPAQTDIPVTKFRIHIIRHAFAKSGRAPPFC